MQRKGPAVVWLVRHGESTGNVARERAEARGAQVIDIAERDADVPLSEHGIAQAQAIGRWLAGLPADARPTAAIASPYLRASETARIALEGIGPTPLYRDERLRDRELGVLDLLTTAGVVARFPDEAARRLRLGKFYHRPPGGESWADVALRLRGVLTDMNVEHDGERVILFTHEALIFLARYVIERLAEPELMTLAHSTELANCSVTSYRRSDHGDLHLVDFNAIDILHKHGAQQTVEPGVRAEPT